MPSVEVRDFTSKDISKVMLSGAINLTIFFGDKTELELIGKNLDKVITRTEEKTLFIEQEYIVGSTTILGNTNVVIKGNNICNSGNINSSNSCNNMNIANNSINIGNNIVGTTITNCLPHYIEATLTIPCIIFLESIGVGNIVVKDFKGNTLELCSTGTGNIKINGSVDYLKINTSGTGNIKAKNLHANSAEIKASGTGNVKSFVIDSLKCRASGVANIVIYGNPEKKDTRISGVGSIKFK